MGRAPTNSPVPREELELGWVRGCHGLRGSLKIKLYSPQSDSLRKGLEIKFRDSEGEIVGVYQICSAVRMDGSADVRLRLRGVESRDEAERLLKCRVCVEKKQLPDLADDEYYLADVIGARVDTRIGSCVLNLGTIVGLSSNGAQDLFEVHWNADDGKRHFWLFPAIPQYIRSVSMDQVIVDLPQGMLPDPLENKISQTQQNSASTDDI